MNWEFLQKAYLGNTISTWGLALAVFIAGSLLITLVLRYLGRRLESFSRKTQSNLDDMVADLLKSRTRKLFITVLALYGASQVLTLSPKWTHIFNAAVFLVFAFQLGVWGNGFINFMVGRRAAQDGEEGLNLEAYSVLTFLAKGTLWVLLILLALHNLGIQVTTLVAGLGVSGIAVALAVQNILGDLFASLSIVLDRPFIIGDFIIVGEQMGNVEHVGLKTTRLRSLSGEQLIFSNTDLLNSRIRNYRRMNERRVVSRLGVIYQTPRQKIEKIPGIIKGIIEEHDLVRFDRAHFSGYGDFSLNFEFVYYVLDREYNLYMDTHQGVLLGIHKAFEEEGIEFAYPTQTIFLQRGETAGKADPQKD